MEQGKRRDLHGRWVHVHVDGVPTRLFVPACAYTGERVPHDATLYPILGDEPGWCAVVCKGICVGVALLVCG